MDLKISNLFNPHKQEEKNQPPLQKFFSNLSKQTKIALNKFQNVYPMEMLWLILSTF